MSAKAKRRLSRPRLFESRVMRVPCYDAQGKPCEHRVRIMPNGHVALLDHSRGEPASVLRACALSGEVPSGCHAELLFGWRQPHWHPRAVHHLLRAFLRNGGGYVKQVPTNRGAPCWVVASDESMAESIAAHGPPVTLSHFFNAPIVTSAGFAKVRVRHLGTVLWDLKLLAVKALLEQGTDPHTPSVLALVRLTKQLLEGWRGILPRG